MGLPAVVILVSAVAVLSEDTINKIAALSDPTLVIDIPPTNTTVRATAASIISASAITTSNNTSAITTSNNTSAITTSNTTSAITNDPTSAITSDTTAGATTTVSTTSAISSISATSDSSADSFKRAWDRVAPSSSPIRSGSQNAVSLPDVSQRFPGDQFALLEGGSFTGSFNESQIVDQCHRTAQCEALEESTCLGVQLPYMHTSLALTGLPNQRIAREHLELWSSLRNIPRCWAVVQPLLCAIFFPRCDNNSLELPSQEMCVITRGPCRLVEHEREWPDFLLCREDYPHKCKNSVRELKFNTTGQCAPPLVATEKESSWYEGVKGCGIQCANPIFTDEEHEDLHHFVAALGGVCLAFASLTVLTYLIDWRAANKYPVLIIFYINGCFLIASIGFIVQFHPGVRHDLTCRSDGTLRQGEPSSGGNLSCVVVFVCVYYFMVAAGLWLIILAYSLHTSFKSYAGLCGDELERRAAYFHLLSWSLPLVLTITIMALAEVEADSVAGICFLSSAIHIRIGFLLLPLATIVFVAGFFFVRGMIKLIYLKMECFNIISDSANSKIVETIIRLALITITLVIYTGITIYCHIYQYRNQHLWDKALRDYIMCVSNMTAAAQLNSGSSVCMIAERPSINVYKLHLLALFGAGIIMSSWCWTPNTLQAWKRFLRRVAGVPSEEPLRLARHRVIAQAFAKRHDLNTAGRLSISLHSIHDDPLGLNFDMNSAASGDLSSAWATAIPYLMTRRGALVGSAALGLRRNSVDSEYSVSRRFSIESGYNNRSSRRHSLDSQMSFHVSDAERLAALHTAARFGRRKRRDWFNLKRGRRVNAWDRRGSNTSDDSNLGSMILPAITMNNQDTLFTNMMKRLNLSSDEATRSERAAPSAPPAKSMNINVPLPGQTTLESEDDIGAENHGYADNDSIAHTVLNNVLKSADLRRKEDAYVRAATALENGLLSSSQVRACSRRGNIDTGMRVTSTSVGIQTSFASAVTKANMVDKSIQVSTPLLMRASQITRAHSPLSSDCSPTHTYRHQDSKKKINETSFSNRRKPQNIDRPDTPVTKLQKKLNVSGDKTTNSKNVVSSHGSHKRNTSSKTGNSGGRRKSRGESAEIMTVLDIGDESD
ncbi:protein smoothened isoform X2 [Cherax quadricarinatus]|uniref:protein smoothened isoform X2 n=1 Tax=Cherax quadricarinatus TaxID=27406 RepID=UPI00387EA5CA